MPHALLLASLFQNQLLSMTAIGKNVENFLECGLCYKFRFISWVTDELLRCFVKFFHDVNKEAQTGLATINLRCKRHKLLC